MLIQYNNIFLEERDVKAQGGRHATAELYGQSCQPGMAGLLATSTSENRKSLQEGTWSCWPFDFQLLSSRMRKFINIYCLKLPTLWHLVREALENKFSLPLSYFLSRDIEHPFCRLDIYPETLIFDPQAAGECNFLNKHSSLPKRNPGARG